MTNQIGRGTLETAGAGDCGQLTFADLLAPLTTERFFADYHGRKFLHVAGVADKFAAVMSWAKLNALLDMTGVWSSHSFAMALDGAMVPARDYCLPAIDRATGANVMQPDAGRVTGLIQRGASLVLNDIDTLNPGLAAVARTLESTLECRSQANLYCSSRAHMAFDSHFDNHDVFALHVEGQKLWRIYEGRLDNPINHPTFQGQPTSFHDKAKGEVAAEILLKPGDLLYIPRGTYHDALARTAGSVHVSFSAMTPIGLDFVSGLFERAVHESLFRADVPRRHVPGGEAAFDRHIQALAERLAAIATEPATVNAFRQFQDRHRYERGGFDLSPVMFESGGYRVGSGFAVIQHGKVWVLTKGNRTTAIPTGLEGAVSWIVARDSFTGDDLSAAVPALSAAESVEIIASLETMGVITREPLHP